MKTINYINLARLTTTLSFLVGTIFFIAFQTSHSFDLASYGLIYIMIAAVINICILFMVLFKAMIDIKNRVKLLLNGLLMLINIPIVFLYMATLKF